MNFSSIDNVQDLIKANEEVQQQEENATAEDKVVDLVLSLGWESGHEIVTRLIQAELSLHQKWLKEGLDMDLSEMNHKINFALLSRDVVFLQQALSMMDSVNTNDDSDEEE